MTQDTYKGNAWDPMSQHLYAYTGNNPTNFIDPTGHYPAPPQLIDGGIIYPDPEPMAVIFYDEEDFSTQANDHSKMLEEQGYSVTMVPIGKENGFEAFNKAWDQYADSMDKAVLIMHGKSDYISLGSEGNNLIVKGGDVYDKYKESGVADKQLITELTHTNADIDILSCNAAHSAYDNNVEKSFAKITSGTVTGYDGNVSFYKSLSRKIYENYEPRLSNRQRGFVEQGFASGSDEWNVIFNLYIDYPEPLGIQEFQGTGGY